MHNALGQIFLHTLHTHQVQYKRRTETARLLDHRQKCERQYVSTMADIIENTHTIRALPCRTILDVFGKDTKAFGDANLSAVQFTVVTKERIELIQGMLLALLFFASAWLVNSAALTRGEV
jgi:hypothetical protein